MDLLQLQSAPLQFLFEGLCALLKASFKSVISASVESEAGFLGSALVKPLEKPDSFFSFSRSFRTSAVAQECRDVSDKYSLRFGSVRSTLFGSIPGSWLADYPDPAKTGELRS